MDAIESMSGSYRDASKRPNEAPTIDVLGDPVVGGLHGPEAQHMFCGHCMTWMFTRPAIAPHIVNVRPSMFDDHADFRPFLETYTNAKLPWAVTGAIHSFEEAPPMERYAALLTELASLHARTK